MESSIADIPDIVVGGNNITIDKSNPNKWIINYSAIPIDNKPPTITIDNNSIWLARDVSEVIANVTISDDNGDVVTKEWSQVSSWRVFLLLLIIVFQD